MWYLSFSCWCCTDLSFLAYVAICHDIATCKYRSTCPRRLECSRTECLKNLLCTVHQKFVVYRTPQICCVQYTKNLLCTVHQKFVVYSTPKICYVQYTKNSLCTVHQKFAVYSTPKPWFCVRWQCIMWRPDILSILKDGERLYIMSYTILTAGISIIRLLLLYQNLPYPLNCSAGNLRNMLML